MKTASTLQARNVNAACIMDSVGVAVAVDFADEDVTSIFEDNSTNVTETFDDTEVDSQEDWKQSSQWWGRCVCYGDWKWT